MGHTDGAIAALQLAAGADADERIKYTRYDTAPPMILGGGNQMPGHACWELAYAEQDLFAWLLRQTGKGRGRSNKVRVLTSRFEAEDGSRCVR